jgi:diguanylate cyclase (GGDEF)-like protein
MEKLAIDKSVIHEEIHFTKDGREIPVEISTRSFEIKDRQFNLSVARDISERKRMEEKLKQLSIHDTLTGLYNRGFFEEELARLERGGQFPVSLVIADIDRLKKVNDRLGHSAGDDLLRGAAQVLTTSFRSEDIVARIGGDEFAIILPNTDGIVAKKMLRRIRQNLRKYNTGHANMLLGISFGVSTAKKSKPLQETLKAADASMYREKRKASSS